MILISRGLPFRAIGCRWKWFDKGTTSRSTEKTASITWSFTLQRWSFFLILSVISIFTPVGRRTLPGSKSKNSLKILKMAGVPADLRVKSTVNLVPLTSWTCFSLLGRSKRRVTVIYCSVGDVPDARYFSNLGWRQRKYPEIGFWYRQFLAFVRNMARMYRDLTSSFRTFIFHFSSSICKCCLTSVNPHWTVIWPPYIALFSALCSSINLLPSCGTSRYHLLLYP